MSATNTIDDQIWPVLKTMRPYARSMARTQEGADDIIQSAAELAWRFRDRYKGPSLSAWLFRIVSRVAIDHWRRRSRLAAAVEYNDLMWLDAEQTPEDFLAQADERAAIWDDLALLPETRRRMLIMQHGLDGNDPMGLSEIADALGVPLGTVMSGLHRAREQIRRLDDPRPRRRSAGQIEIWEALGNTV